MRSAFYKGIHVLFLLQSVASFLMWTFFIVYLSHYVFFHVWNKCITVWNSYMLCSIYCFWYSTKISSKFNTKFILQCSVLMVYSCSSFPPENYKSTMVEWLSFLYVEISCISSIYFCYNSWLSRPMVLCLVSTNFTNNL